VSFNAAFEGFECIGGKSYFEGYGGKPFRALVCLRKVHSRQSHSTCSQSTAPAKHKLLLLRTSYRLGK